MACSRVGLVLMSIGLVLPQTRSPHRCTPSPPRITPSTNTTKNRAAASRLALVVAMVAFRYHHQSFISGRRSTHGIGKKQISHNDRTCRSRIRLRAPCPARIVCQKQTERQAGGHSESPAKRNKRLPETAPLRTALFLRGANPRHYRPRKRRARIR